MKYDIPQRVFLVSEYYEFKSMSNVINAWNTNYKNSDPPSRSTIKNIFSNFEKRAKLLTYLQSGKFRTQNAKLPKSRWKRWSQNFPSCRSAKQPRLSLFHKHLYTRSTQTTFILAPTNFIYGINWRTKITKKG